MTIKELIDLLNGKGINIKNLNEEVERFSIDSRTIKEGEFFVALRGKNFDGHKFIKEAIKKGAKGYITEKEQCKYFNGIKVDDTLEALRKIARYKRKKLKHLVGITGTAGKTTTKELAKKVLAPYFKVYGTEGNYNNHIGLPLTLANTPKDAEVGIFEFGANKIGDIAELVEIAKPDIRVLTSIGIAHTEGFGSLEGIIKGKGEIFMNSDKNVLPYKLLAYYNLDNYITFGKEEEADIRIKNVKIVGDGTIGEISYKDKSIKLKIPIFNKAIFENIGAVAGILYYLGLDPIKPLKILESFQAVKGRGNTIKKGNITIIDESYNANPLSVANSILTLSEIPSYKILVLGDMLELGELSEEEHENIGQLILSSGIDTTYLYGDKTRATYKVLKGKRNVYHFKEMNRLLEQLKKEIFSIKEPIVILIKGSNSMKMGELINKLVEQL